MRNRLTSNDTWWRGTKSFAFDLLLPHVFNCTWERMEHFHVPCAPSKDVGAELDKQHFSDWSTYDIFRTESSIRCIIYALARNTENKCNQTRAAIHGRERRTSFHIIRYRSEWSDFALQGRTLENYKHENYSNPETWRMLLHVCSNSSNTMWWVDSWNGDRDLVTSLHPMVFVWTISFNKLASDANTHLPSTCNVHRQSAPCHSELHSAWNENYQRSVANMACARKSKIIQTFVSGITGVSPLRIIMMPSQAYWIITQLRL